MSEVPLKPFELPSPHSGLPKLIHLSSWFQLSTPREQGRHKRPQHVGGGRLQLRGKLRMLLQNGCARAQEVFSAVERTARRGLSARFATLGADKSTFRAI